MKVEQKMHYLYAAQKNSTYKILAILASQTRANFLSHHAKSGELNFTHLLQTFIKSRK